MAFLAYRAGGLGAYSICRRGIGGPLLLPPRRRPLQPDAEEHLHAGGGSEAESSVLYSSAEHSSAPSSSTFAVGDEEEAVAPVRITRRPAAALHCG